MDNDKATPFLPARFLARVNTPRREETVARAIAAAKVMEELLAKVHASSLEEVRRRTAQEGEADED